MPSTRQFFINLKIEMFGSGINQGKKDKPSFESRTYRYSSASSRDFNHAKQRSRSVSTIATTSSVATTSSTSSTRTTLSRASTVASKPIRIISQSRNEEVYTSSVPGSWPEEEEEGEIEDHYGHSPPQSYPRIQHKYSKPQFYQRTQYKAEPSYNKIRYPVQTPTPIVRGRNTVYIKPMTISNEPMGTRRHLRSGSDILIVHHPTPQDLEDY
ncbi:hypothetical protein WAI453_011727 [Rhynchosporium graminicola]